MTDVREETCNRADQTHGECGHRGRLQFHECGLHGVRTSWAGGHGWDGRRNILGGRTRAGTSSCVKLGVTRIHRLNQRNCSTETSRLSGIRRKTLYDFLFFVNSTAHVISINRVRTNFHTCAFLGGCIQLHPHVVINMPHVPAESRALPSAPLRETQFPKIFSQVAAQMTTPWRSQLEVLRGQECRRVGSQTAAEVCKCRQRLCDDAHRRETHAYARGVSHGASTRAHTPARSPQRDARVCSWCESQCEYARTHTHACTYLRIEGSLSTYEHCGGGPHPSRCTEGAWRPLGFCVEGLQCGCTPECGQ